MTVRDRAAALGWRKALKGLATLCACVVTYSGHVDAADPPIIPGQTVASDAVAAEIDLQRGILDLRKGRYQDVLRRLDGPGGSAPGASYYRGLALLGLNRTDEALRTFEAIRGAPGAPTEAGLGSGVAKLRLGDTEGAASALDAYVKARPDDLQGHYLLGVAKVRQGRAEDAREHFARASADPGLAPYLDPYRSIVESVDANPGLPPLPAPSLAESPPTATDPRVDSFTRLNAMPGGPGVIPGPNMTGVNGGTTGPGNPDRRYNLALLNGYEFDTNVALAPSLALSGLGAINHKVDSRYLIASFGEYRLVQRKDWVLGVIGSTYDSYQFRQTRYNIQDYMGGAYSNVSLGNVILGGRYEFHETLLGGNQFTTDHRLTPNLTIREGTLGHFTSFYEYEAVDVKGLALVPAQRRTGNINAIGATQAFYLAEGNGRLYFNYRYENAQTQGSDFDRSTNQISARLEIPIPGKMVFNTEFRQFFDDYKHPNSLDFLNRVRVDRRIEARVGIQKFFTDHTSLRVDYVYTNNQSNVENLFNSSFYTYHRSVLSTQFIYDF